MPIDEQTNLRLHKKLPIDEDESVLAVYRHHWFAYASNWILGGLLVVVIMGLAVGVVAFGGSNSSIDQYKAAILGGAALFSLLILLGTYIPVYLRSQEQLVLTDEALFQVLQPSLFASKVDQLNLQRIDDVSVHQDFLGTLFGYGHLTIETPGEQDNYEFFMLPNAQDVARDISNARENYEAAMQSGRLPTTLGQPQPAVPTIDPQHYQEFLAYEQQKAQQEQPAMPSVPPEQPPAGPGSAEPPQPTQDTTDPNRQT